MLTEKVVIDKLEVLADGTVQVREATVIERDGVEVSRSFHRFVIPITDANPDLSRFDDASKAIVVAARTPERLAAGAARLAEAESGVV